MTLSQANRKKPTSIEAWREEYQSDDWDMQRLQDNPPRWMAVQYEDGTGDFAYVSGVRTRFPSVVVTVHGSNLSAEVAPMTIVRCLREGRPIRI